MVRDLTWKVQKIVGDELERRVRDIFVVLDACQIVL